jgi:hypothetical protein
VAVPSDFTLQCPVRSDETIPCTGSAEVIRAQAARFESLAVMSEFEGDEDFGQVLKCAWWLRQQIASSTEPTLSAGATWRRYLSDLREVGRAPTEPIQDAFAAAWFAITAAPSVEADPEPQLPWEDLDPDLLVITRGNLYNRRGIYAEWYNAAVLHLALAMIQSAPITQSGIRRRAMALCGLEGTENGDRTYVTVAIWRVWGELQGDRRRK